MARRIFQLDFDPPGLRVTEGIHQGFASNAIGFIAKDRTQGSWPSFNQDTKVNRLLKILIEGEFLWDARKCLFEISIVLLRKADASNCVPPFINNLSH